MANLLTEERQFKSLNRGNNIHIIQNGMIKHYKFITINESHGLSFIILQSTNNVLSIESYEISNLISRHNPDRSDDISVVEGYDNITVGTIMIKQLQNKITNIQEVYCSEI